MSARDSWPSSVHPWTASPALHQVFSPKNDCAPVRPLPRRQASEKGSSTSTGTSYPVAARAGARGRLFRSAPLGNSKFVAPLNRNFLAKRRLIDEQPIGLLEEPCVKAGKAHRFRNTAAKRKLIFSNPLQMPGCPHLKICWPRHGNSIKYAGMPAREPTPSLSCALGTGKDQISREIRG